MGQVRSGRRAIAGGRSAAVVAVITAVVAAVPVGGCDDPELPVALIEDVACPFEIPAGEAALCGRVELPEHHGTTNGRTISMFFARTLSTAPVRDDGPVPAPVVVLNGGPGQAGSDMIDGAWAQMAVMRRDRDLIFVDQRGTGHSDPDLYCRDLDPVAYWHGGFTTADAERCLAPLTTAGHDPAAFNTPESALDLIALRRALGLPAWNLLGVSYGTILALEVVRHDPDGVQAVILNSPNTTRASWLDLKRMQAIRDVYTRLFADCAADPRCRAAYPALARAFLDLADRLDRRPIAFTTTDPRTGAEVAGELTFTKLLNILTIIVGSGDNARRVPQLLWHLHQATAGEVPPHLPTVAFLYMPYWNMMDQIAYGLNVTIGCSEVRPWVDAESARTAASLLEPYVAPHAMEVDYDVFCPVWDLPRAEEALRDPVTSDRPTLILTGVYDTLTPTYLADTVARTLTNAQVMRFRGLGHDVLSVSACAREAAAAFLIDPDRGHADRCTAEDGPPAFTVP